MTFDVNAAHFGRWLVCFATALFMLTFPSAGWSEGVRETNYNHTDPDQSISVKGIFSVTGKSGEITRFDGGRITNKTGTRDSLGAEVPKWSVEVVFDEDICVVGTYVKVDTNRIRNSVRVIFTFRDRDQKVIAQEVRFPAGGTTRQSFSSNGFASRFASVEVSASTGNHFALGNIRALRCAVSIS